MNKVQFNVFNRKSRQWELLTLVPYQCFEIAGGGATDDGYSYWKETYVYDYDSGAVRRCQEDWSADAVDSEESTTFTYCPVDKLCCVPVSDDLARPDWEIDHSQEVQGV